MAKKAAATPATALLTAERVPFELDPYDVSPDAPNYGALVAQASGVAPEAVFKTVPHRRRAVDATPLSLVGDSTLAPARSIRTAVATAHRPSRRG
jgi:hypothetical protein